MTKRRSMCDLPAALVGQAILTRVPITSLRAVRSTCKLWDALTKEWVLGKSAAARQQFLGFMSKDSKVCSVKFNLCRNKDKEDEDLHDVSIKQVARIHEQVDFVNQVEISQVFHCDGLLFCVTKDNSRLVVWNPYLGQTKWIAPRTDFHRADSPRAEIYAFGYDINRNYKILRFLSYCAKPDKRHEIYEFCSNSWRVLNVTSDWEMMAFCQVGMFVKGNSYFIANIEIYDDEMMDEGKDFLLGFDFTTERFGSRLPLPFHSNSYSGDTVALSCVKEENLAVLYQQEGTCNIVQIWVTTTIEPNYVSWSQFLRVEMKPNPTTFLLNDFWFKRYINGGSFFIDEEEKLAVVFGLAYQRNKICYHTAFIFGEDGYFKSVSLGVAAKELKPCLNSKYSKVIYGPPFVCSSSYRPSFVQVNQPHQKKRKR